ncbi:TRAP transporter substrate-binding protein DctP [Marinobacter salarius]|uniref:TRAP transporter substrate-binding protein n=1 Tax=Marinobacter salarius TaxID=1420917 RepID=UPI00273C9D5A|nr:TRAP transporter substrate-binding protein DctP [Marinobacter salarius]MDP4534097.1 TRAP transporter substrate-binding protein DctP [Marinobacter salarius]
MKFISIAATLILMLMASSVWAEKITLRMAILGGVSESAYGEAMSKVPDAVSQATDGNVEVEIYDSLISPTELPTAVRSGRIDMIGAVHVYMTGEEPRFGVGHLPGLLRGAEDYQKVLNAFMGDMIADVWDSRYNAHALAQGIWYAQPHFSNQPLRTLSDFKGLKVRTHNAEAAQVLRAIGAQPAQIAASEMAGALQRGVIDALSTETGSAYSLGVQDAATYISGWQFGDLIGWTVAMNNEKWNSLPDEVKAQIGKGLSALQEERFETYASRKDKKLDLLIGKGMEYIEIAPEEQQKLFDPDVVGVVYEDWYQRVEEVGGDGQAIVKRAREVLGR